MEDQLTDHPKKDVLRGGSTTGKSLLLGLGPAVVVMVGLLVGVVFFNKPVDSTPGNPTSASAQADADSDEAQIRATMERYVDGYNSGDAALFMSSVCERVLAVNGNLDDRPPLEEGRAQLNGVEDVQITGDTATASVTASEGGASEPESKTTTLQFVNENGWKLC